ncbi:MAG: hypothetical protein MUP15_10640 [Dehalococcoidia bacterium]|nr:hypothetical protein [Dehalococcoidia bacterium]
MDRVVAVRFNGRVLPMVLVTRKDNGSFFFRGLVGDRSIYFSYEADGHYHLRDPKAPLTWKDEARIRIAQLEGYRNPERQHGYHDCQKRQPTATLKGDECIATFLAGDIAEQPPARYLRDAVVIEVPDWHRGARVAVEMYISETGQVDRASGEQRVILQGPPSVVAAVSVEQQV